MSLLKKFEFNIPGNLRPVNLDNFKYKKIKLKKAWKRFK